MTSYEYKVVPAPTKGQKAKGVKTGEDRFALGLQILMNAFASDGWEFQRAETLPSTERAGLTGSTTEWRNVLVFRREVSSSVNNAIQTEAYPVSAPEPARESEAELSDDQYDPTPEDDASDIQRLRKTLYPRQEPKLTDNSDA
ncbi:MAG: DUF4177 domain-containing protein [Paracoccaceae bacterium]